MIWLIGRDGMLGRETAGLLREMGVPFTGTGRHEVDVTRKDAPLDFIRGGDFDCIINCSAYTAVDNAEDDADNCAVVNTRGAENIARAAKEAGAALVHISTDYVFGGSASRPRLETDRAAPQGVYGKTKYDGEICIQNMYEKYYIIRTAWLYGEGGKNFVNTMLRLMAEKDAVSVVDDQTGSPTWTFGLASAIVRLVSHNSAKPAAPFGIYHYAGTGACTWFQFTCAIYRHAREIGLLQKDCRIQPCTSAEFKTKVKRPAYSVLDTTKIRAALGIEIPGWEESLKKYLRQLAGG
ncbi:MAG: dTDP-4-dehydrorhamnose reductase [Spirochaetaceae bacterium]|nr:dTDP-4-dehydrorhamnose reductase [Spirochaetaceae bacterium]